MLSRQRKPATHVTTVYRINDTAILSFQGKVENASG